MKITVVGAGYVGLSNAVLLAQNNSVTIYDLDSNKIELLKKSKSPIKDDYISDYLVNKELELISTNEIDDIFKETDFCIIATPTDYDVETKYFNTKSIESTLEKVFEQNKNCLCIIKSTIPIGYVEKVKHQFNTENIIFMPEFLREGKALYDNLYPSRIIVGEISDRAEKIAKTFVDCTEDKNVKVLYMNSTEAESVKLFSNTYLAMRIAYFNELDTYAEYNNLDTESIIKGMSADPRIGDYYNNPSFGFGGYCLPKDTKQLLVNFEDVPNDIIKAICQSNDTRKQHIANMILNRKSKVVGVYRLTMKSGSDNFRSSAIQDIINLLIKNGVEVIIYEPMLKETHYSGLTVHNDFEVFCNKSDVILANRWDELLEIVKDKVYTKDIFKRD